MRFQVRTSDRVGFFDITEEVARAVAASGVTRGAALVFCPHTTAAVTVNENADPDVVRDLTAGLDRVAPAHAGYLHAEGNSDGHIKTTLVGPQVMVPVDGSKLALGTWQTIYLCEFDGPRTRTVDVTVLPGVG